jgi:hypothetical protein
MKTPIPLVVLLIWACAKPDLESERKKLIELIDNETRYAAAADSVSWAACWDQSEEAIFTIASLDGAQQWMGWRAIKSGLRDIQPFDLKLKRDNYHFIIDNQVAFVSFDQYDNWGGTEGRHTKETRTLKKVDGQWKIVQTSVIGVSSYDRRNTPSFHVAKEKITVDPRTSFRNQSGLGGMYVGSVEVPAGTDFTPLFEGLPQNNCPSPHWGYLLEGTIRIKYPDGKEDVVTGGEVFYWPATHTGFVEKNAKLIDFSPEAEFSQLMDHIATRMAEKSAK